MAKNGGQVPTEGGVENEEDLTVFVQSLLQQMQSRFTNMSETIIGRIDEMGGRIDDLEKSIADLMQEAGGEKENGAMPTAKIEDAPQPVS
eukprot:GSMAST32.ASY1.ANO1.2378.1 assembled CDS